MYSLFFKPIIIQAPNWALINLSQINWNEKTIYSKLQTKQKEKKWAEPKSTKQIFFFCSYCFRKKTNPSAFGMVTISGGVASAGLSQCYNRTCWWMTPLLYRSMLCHLQLHAARPLSPCRVRMSLHCSRRRKWRCLSLKLKTNKQANISCRNTSFMIGEAAWLCSAPGR